MKDLLKEIWQKRLFSYTGLAALVLLYFEVFHKDTIDQFYKLVFLDLGKPLITNVVTNPQVTAALTGVIIVWLGWLKKKGEK